MAVYNGEAFLIDSINSILNQSFTDFEFIIIDDGSTDKTNEIINSFNDKRIRLTTQKNKGLSASLYHGVNICQGKYIARMDADDIALPERLKSQIEFFHSKSNCVGIGSNAILIDEEGKEVGKTHLNFSNFIDLNYLRVSNPFIHSTMFLDKNAVLQVGNYNNQIRHFSEDDLLWVDLCRTGKMYILTDLLIKYRIVSNSISSLLPKKIKNNLRSIRISYIDTGKLSTESISYINNLKDNRCSRLKKSLYYLYIGKLLLVNNDKKNARRMLLKVYSCFLFTLKPLLYLIVSFFPINFIKRIKKIFKYVSH